MQEPLTEPDAPTSGRHWGLIDIPIGLLLAVGLSVLGVALSVAFSSGFERSSNAEELSDSALVLSTIGFQIGMGGWVWWVARRRGAGVGVDFGFAGRNIDLGIGLLATAFIFPAALAVNWVVSTLVGLEFGSDEAGNTDILNDLGGTGLFFVMVSAVLIAPITEELFFRGLCLRAIERRFGTAAAVVGSTFLFVVPHFTFASWEGTIVLFAQISLVGLVLALITVRLDRLGPAIVTHMCFNLVGTLAAVSAMQV